jgi:predicted transcriptional regulator
MAKNEKIAIEIAAEDNASKVIDKLTRRIDGLEADEARIVVSAQTDKLEDQLRRAREKLDDLDGDEASVQLRAIGNLEADLGEAQRLLAELDGKTGTVTIEAKNIDKVAGDLDRVQGSTRGISETAQSGIGPLRGFTDELGGAAQQGGVLGNALIDAGEAVEILGAKAGLSQKAVGTLSGVFGVVGLAVTGVITVWSLLNKKQNENTESAKKLLDIQRQLAEQKWAEAAASFVEEYGDKLRNAADYGIGFADSISYITGEVDRLDVPDNLTGFDAIKAVAEIETLRQEFGKSAAELVIVDEITGQLQSQFGETFGAGTENTKDFKGAVTDAKDEVSELDETIRGLNEMSTVLDLEQDFDDLARKAEEAWIATAEGAVDAEEKQRDYQQSLIDTKIAVFEYGREVLGLPDEVISDIYARFPEETPEQIKARLDDVAGERVITFRSIFTGTPPTAIGVYAPGLNYDGSTDRDRNPATGGGRSTGVNVVVNLPRAAEGRDVTAAIDKWARVDGRP